MKNKEQDGQERQERHLAPVYQSNPLLQARKHYGIMEHRLLRLAIADVRPQLRNAKYFDTEFRPFHISTKDLLSLFQEGAGADDHRIYDKLRIAYRNMIKSYVEISNGIKDVTVIPVFESIKFSAKDGLYITFNRSMMPYLLKLENGCYTKTLLGMAFLLSSSYSLILLELMLQYQGRAVDGVIVREINLDELRFSLDVPPDAYKNRMDNFRRKVVDSAISDINESTDYYIEPDYDMLRGRHNRVIGFRFILHLPTPQPILAADAVSVSADLVDRLRGYGIAAQVAQHLATLPNAEKSLEIALRYIKQGKAKNPAGYIRTALEQDWHTQHATLQRALEQERNAAKDRIRQARDFVEETQQEPLTDERLANIVAENKGNALAQLAQKFLDRRKQAESAE